MADITRVCFGRHNDNLHFGIMDLRLHLPQKADSCNGSAPNAIHGVPRIIECISRRNYLRVLGLRYRSKQLGEYGYLLQYQSLVPVC